MAQFFKETVGDKVAFLGVSSDETDDRLRDFMKQTSMSWPQIREPFAGTLHQTYRVEGEPTYFLIGPKSEVLDTWVGGGLAIDRVTAFLRTLR